RNQEEGGTDDQPDDGLDRRDAPEVHGSLRMHVAGGAYGRPVTVPSRFLENVATDGISARRGRAGSIDRSAGCEHSTATLDRHGIVACPDGLPTAGPAPRPASARSL